MTSTKDTIASLFPHPALTPVVGGPDAEVVANLEAVLHFCASDMILHIDSDASYLS